MKVTVVCENTVTSPVPRGLIGEHGLSMIIENGKTTLYDTGQGPGILNNLKLLGKDVNAIERIVLSHGHYDHTGGLMNVLGARNSGVPVMLHREAFDEKIARFNFPDRVVEIPIGFDHPREDYEKAGAEFSFLDRLVGIDDGISAISSVRRPPGWKVRDPLLKVRRGDEVIDDPFNDDLSLLLETGSGPVVLLGCAHSGIVEILEDLSAETGHSEFHAVIGGTHLASADARYFENTIETLKKYSVEVIGTSHCTGFRAAARLAGVFGDRFKTASVGDTFEF